MVSIVSLFTVFMLGFVAGFSSVIAIGWWQIKKAQKAKQRLIEEIRAKAEEIEQKFGPIKERMAKVGELTKQQLELLSQVDRPSMNAVHSKYKNGLNAQIKDIEQEKMDILKSILKEGHDPVITIMNSNNEREQLKLSEYMARNGVEMHEPVAETPDGPKKVGKFFVYSGGQGDDTTH